MIKLLLSAALVLAILRITIALALQGMHSFTRRDFCGMDDSVYAAYWDEIANAKTWHEQDLALRSLALMRCRPRMGSGVYHLRTAFKLMLALFTGIVWLSFVFNSGLTAG